MKGEGRIYQRPGRPVWMLDYYGEINGRCVRLRESSGTTDEEKARALLRERVESAHVAAKSGATVETPAHRRFTVGEALDEYLRDLALREKKTAKDESYRLGPDSPLRQKLGAFRVCELTRAKLVRYAEDRRGEGRANKTINNDLSGLRSALLLAEESGKLLRVPPFPGKLRERVRTGFPDPSEPEALAEHSPAWLAEWSGSPMPRAGAAASRWPSGGSRLIGMSGRSGCPTRRTTRGALSRSRVSSPRSWSDCASGGKWHDPTGGSPWRRPFSTTRGGRSRESVSCGPGPRRGRRRNSRTGSSTTSAARLLAASPTPECRRLSRCGLPGARRRRCTGAIRSSRRAIWREPWSEWLLERKSRAAGESPR